MGEFIISIIKLLLAIALLPFSIATARELYSHIILYLTEYGNVFYSGAVTFLFVFLFIHPLTVFYEFNKKMIEGMFSLIAPLNRGISQILSLYLIVAMISFYISNHFIKISRFDSLFVFAIGFLFAMHIILTAQDLQSAETSIFKPEYLLMINITIIINIFLLVFSMDFIAGKHSFIKFSKVVWQASLHIYQMCIGRISS